MAYFKRQIDEELLKWKNDSNRKPLILRGARQVGKSSAVRQLGKTFKYFIEANLERDIPLRNIFKNSYKPKEIAARIAFFYGIPAEPGKTLLFLDEIQSCPEAIHSLWFFKEDYPELHVVAAGSLLEFALKDLSSFGVGRVRSIFMNPLSFDEFEEACGHTMWNQAKKEATSDAPLFDSIHEKLVEEFRTFLMVGGMPEAVSTWIESGEYTKCRQIHRDIIQTYEDDFAKYGSRIQPTILRATLKSAAKQIGGKFVFSNVDGDYRTDNVKEALTLLSDAGIIKPVYHSAANGLPLGADTNTKFVKYLFLDSALAIEVLGRGAEGRESITKQLLTDSATDLVNKGGITEMVAGLELIKYSCPYYRNELYYWQNLARGTQAEVDYVIASHGGVLPLEVKAGTSGSMKSLWSFMESKSLTHGVRLSLENFSQIKGTASGREVCVVPLYAISNLFSAPQENDPNTFLRKQE